MRVNRKNLDLAMARACMTPAALAAAAGMPRPTVNNVMGGKGVRPATMGRVARALGVDVSELIQDDAAQEEKA